MQHHIAQSSSLASDGPGRGRLTPASRRRRKAMAKKLTLLVNQVVEATGWSSARIAEETGYSTTSIDRYRSGQCLPRPGEQYDTAVEMLKLILREKDSRPKATEETYAPEFPAPGTATLVRLPKQSFWARHTLGFSAGMVVGAAVAASAVYLFGVTPS
jgi:hypothetical protein